jgi:hypothetical protein
MNSMLLLLYDLSLENNLNHIIYLLKKLLQTKKKRGFKINFRF